MVATVGAWLVKSLPRGLAVWSLRVQGLLITALGTAAFNAWVVSSSLGTGQSNPWIEAVGACAWRTAFTFVPIGIAVWVLASPFKSANESSQRQHSDLTPRGLKVFSLTLVGLAALALMVATPLVALWAEVYQWLDAAGAWTELRRAWGSQFGGLALGLFLPIPLVAFLELAPGASMVAGSAALLTLSILRVPRLARLSLASLLLYGALTAGSFYVSDLTSRLTPPLVRSATEEMGLPTDAIAWLQQHDAAARSAARRFGWLLLGYLVWVPALFWSRRAETQLVDPATRPSRSLGGLEESEESGLTASERPDDRMRDAASRERYYAEAARRLEASGPPLRAQWRALLVAGFVALLVLLFIVYTMIGAPAR